MIGCSASAILKRADGSDERKISFRLPDLTTLSSHVACARSYDFTRVNNFERVAIDAANGFPMGERVTPRAPMVQGPPIIPHFKKVLILNNYDRAPVVCLALKAIDLLLGPLFG